MMKHLCEDCCYCKRIIENLEGYTETFCRLEKEKIMGVVRKCAAHSQEDATRTKPENLVGTFLEGNK